MSTSSFSRALRALQSEQSRTQSWLTWLLLLVVVAWLAWALLARVPVTESAVNAEVLDEQTAVAHFSPAALAHLQSGQPALIRLDAFPADSFGAVPATVGDIDRTIRDGLISVTFHLSPDGTSIPLQPGLTGQVEVETGRTSPAGLLLTTLK